MVTSSRDVASILGLSEEQIKSDEFLQLFTGNIVPEEFSPYSMCYGGHQFGHWAGQLGDGRAINLAEVNTPLHGHKVLQLKGAGPTPFSRTADGLAVLRSSVREFLCSEAMFHLGTRPPCRCGKAASWTPDGPRTQSVSPERSLCERPQALLYRPACLEIGSKILRVASTKGVKRTHEEA